MFNINGKVPCMEMECLTIPYISSHETEWYLALIPASY